MHIRHGERVWLWVVGSAVLAATLYYSWPLGYLLNPIASRHGLASDLEAKDQPYNWVFIVMDIASGLLVIYVAWWLSKLWQGVMTTAIKLILWGYAIFGALTVVSALLPENCLADQHQCAAVLHDPLVILHGIASIISIGALTVSLIGIWQVLVITQRGVSRLRWLLHALLLTWFGFGLLTLGLILANRSSNNAQHAFLTICSVCMTLIPYLVTRLHKQEQQLLAAVRKAT